MKFALLIFILVPMVEIWLLISVGSEIGALPTIGLIILTAVIGVFMIRLQGLTTLMLAGQRLQMGQVPAREMIEGMMLALAGVLLLVPGFATDTLGFICLVPPVRQWLASRLLARGAVARAGAQSRGPRSGGPRARQPGDLDGRTLEGDFTRDDDDTRSRDK